MQKDFMVGLPCNKCEGVGELYIGGLSVYTKCPKCNGTGTKKIIKARKGALKA